MEHFRFLIVMDSRFVLCLVCSMVTALMVAVSMFNNFAANTGHRK